MAISGRIAAAARGGLEDLLAQKLLEERLAQQQAQQQFNNQMEERQQTFRESEAARAADQFDRTRRDRANEVGLAQMTRDRATYDEELQGRAADEIANDPNTPPAIRRLFGLKKAGINAQPSADMLVSPEERAAAQAEADAHDLDMYGKKRAIDARFSPRASAPPERHPHVVNGKTVYLTEDEVNAMGGVEPTPRQRPVSGAERQTLGFYNRMSDAIETMDRLEDKLTSSDIYWINNQPLGETVSNMALSEAGQQYAQALQAYTEARLRKESGAAIAAHEFANDRTNVARQVGDKRGNVAQKRALRRRTAEGMANASGAAYEEFYGVPFERNARGSEGLKVRMRAPDGSEMDVDQKDVAHYQKRGATVVGAQ